ncbi:hypothetical protein VSS74_24060 [Conexibacter stalactiti]|uniref:DAPG hydrolase PhiG domain-containing protein n=1 Tax=Conexibacter stalactiti TaxID=1940611 RepID=A0ABU4HVU4_9ACTN|nr:hypothetical protein [Conexibacter stalactiti]MDW5597445.1 hypothetical protein [Conexibacter stalactiti]MEC5038087.1 hypothetical protein [Conexibacter stalactiti]
MGLFSRKDAEGRPHRLPGYAALAREDMADARRRRPDADLSGYAAARGLDALGSQNAAGYFAVLPLDAQLQFNVMRGVLPGGRDGCIYHWLRAWPVDGKGDAVGTFYGKLWAPPLPKGWWKPSRHDIPYIGWMFNPTGEAEYESAIGVPCTVAATLLPEASLIPDFVIDNRARPLLGGNRIKLKERGISGFELVHDGAPPPDAVIERLLAPGSVWRQLLASGGRNALYELYVSRGTVAIRRNGYVTDEGALDGMARSVCAAAEALREAVLAEADPRPFDSELPAVDWPPSGVSVSGRFPPSPWLEALHGCAAELSMTLEEPAAYHRAFPSVAVPGRAFAVLRGTLPGTAVPARIAFHHERPLNDNQGRTALLLEAAPGTEETPPWGVRVDEPRLGYSVRDGIVALWILRSSGRNGDLGDLSGFLTTAFGYAIERGLVET